MDLRTDWADFCMMHLCLPLLQTVTANDRLVNHLPAKIYVLPPLHLLGGPNRSTTTTEAKGPSPSPQTGGQNRKETVSHAADEICVQTKVVMATELSGSTPLTQTGGPNRKDSTLPVNDADDESDVNGGSQTTDDDTTARKTSRFAP